jgi:hypothetical protein
MKPIDILKKQVRAKKREIKNYSPLTSESVKPKPSVRLTKKWRDEARQEFFDKYGNWID